MREETRQFMERWLLNEVTTPTPLQQAIAANAVKNYDKFFKDMADRNKSNQAAQEVSRVNQSLISSNKKAGIHHLDHAIPDKEILQEMQKRCLELSGEDRDKYVHLSMSCIAWIFRNSGYELSMPGNLADMSDELMVQNYPELKNFTLSQLKGYNQRFDANSMVKGLKFYDWQDGDRKLAWHPHGKESPSSPSRQNPSSSPQAGSHDGLVPQTGSDPGSEESGQPGSDNASASSGVDMPPSRVPANDNDRTQSAAPLSGTSQPQGARAAAEESSQALPDFEEDVVNLDLRVDTRLTDFGYLVGSRKVGIGSRHIVNLGTEKVRVYRTFPGSHFGKGVGEELLKKFPLPGGSSLSDRKGTDVDILRGIARVEPSANATKSRPITYYLVKWKSNAANKEGSEEWLTFSELRPILGPKHTEDVTVRLLASNAKKMEILEEYKSRKRHPDTKEPLTKEDRKLTPWLFPREVEKKQTGRKRNKEQQYDSSESIRVEE